MTPASEESDENLPLITFSSAFAPQMEAGGGTSDIFPELEPDPRAQTRGGLFPSSAPLGCGAGRVSNPDLVQPSALRGGLLTTP